MNKAMKKQMTKMMNDHNAKKPKSSKKKSHKRKGHK